MNCRQLHILVWAGLAAAIVSIFFYLPAVRPFIAGDDFFHYVCSSRDIGFGIVPGSEHGAYFPGIYRFCYAAFLLTDGSLAGLQWCFAGVLLINAILIGGIVFRNCRNVAASVFSAVWYLVLCSRFEGFFGMAEPIATVPFLAGLLVWSGQPLRGRRGLWLTLALACGIGFSLYVKQQAGLLSLGAISIFVYQRTTEAPRKHQWRYVFALPLFSALVFLAGVFAEGRGLDPLRRGLNVVASYPARGALWRNFSILGYNDISFLAAMGLAILGWLWIVSHPDLRRRFDVGRLQLIGFAVIASSATLVQFFVRIYYHYALLTIPGIIIACVLLGHELFMWLSETGKLTVAKQAAMTAVAAVVLLASPSAGNSPSIRVWHVWPLEDFVAHNVWSLQPRIAADLDRLKTLVKPGTTMSVIPARHVAPFLLLRTRAVPPWQYAFGTSFDWSKLHWDELEYVLVITSDREHFHWQESYSDDAVLQLEKHGFQLQTELSTMSLYRRR